LVHLRKAAHELSQVVQDGDVEADDLRETWALNFDGDLFARVQSRAIDLAERGGGNRFGINLRVSLLRTSAKLFFDARKCLRSRKGRHLILQLDEFFDVREREQVAARAERLTDFNERRA